MDPFRQPDHLKVLPQFAHSPCLSVHIFSVLQPLPLLKFSFSGDDLASYLEKTKATKKKTSRDSHHLSYPPSRTCTRTLCPICSFLKQCLLPCALDLIPYLSNITIFSFSNESFSCYMQTCWYFSYLKNKTSKQKNFLNPTIPDPSSSLHKTPWWVVYTQVSNPFLSFSVNTF